MLWTRYQLALLLVLTATAGVGLAVGTWRGANPELAARLEQFDRVSATPAPVLSPELVWAQPGASSPTATLARRDARPRPKSRPAPPFLVPRSPARDDAAALPLDLNQASAPELSMLPGIGRALASRIVAVRETDGPFAALHDLRRVRGMSEAKLECVRPFVTIAPSRDDGHRMTSSPSRTDP